LLPDISKVEREIFGNDRRDRTGKPREAVVFCFGFLRSFYEETSASTMSDWLVTNL
jgi:hypothetical protein